MTKNKFILNNLKKAVAVLLAFAFLAGIMTGCSSEQVKEFEKLEDFEHAKIGVLTGSSQELIVKEKYPEAERIYFSNPSDLVLAVEQGKIDGYMFGSPFLPATIWENANVKRIEESVAKGDIAFAFPKDGSRENIRKQLNNFIKQCDEDGTLEQLNKKWQGDTEPTEHPDYMSLTGENGTIHLAAAAENKPLIYQYKNQCSGFEMELLTLFAKEYGYRFDIDIVPFESIIVGMATGKYDMASASLQITEERAEGVSFSDPFMEFEVVFVVKDNDNSPKAMTLSDLDNATIGIIVGTNWDLVAQERFPNAEKMYFTSAADALLALEQEKIDSFFCDNTVLEGMKWENENLSQIDEPIETISNALIMAKDDYDENLLVQLNKFIAESKENGTIDSLEKKWFGGSEPSEHPDYDSLSGENGTIKIAIGDSMKPTAYRNGDHYTGYEVEFLTLFAEKYGYKLDVEGMVFEAIIPSVASGKSDIGACGITITPERMESVTFTDVNCETYGVAAVRKDSSGKSSAGNDIRTLEDLQDASIAILTGSIWNDVAHKEFPGSEIKYFTTISDMFLSLEQEKVDVILGDRTFYTSARWENVPVRVLDETVGHISCGFMFEKENYDEVLFEQLNEFIAMSKENGTIDALAEKWLSDKEPTEYPDYKSLSGENGTLKIAVDDTSKPMTYRKNDIFTGFDVDLLTEFARQYGYRLEFEGMAFGSLITAVASGKSDISACGTAITPERQESVTFSDCYLEVDGVVIVNNSTEQTTEESFIDGIAESFEKTFIREDRWKLIVKGIGVTMLISISSAFLGTILGFGLYMLSRSDAKLLQKTAKRIAKIYSRIISGTPVVVILMILFYVVFGHFRDMSGVLVAIIGFTLVFGAFVYDHMVVSVNSVAKGQTEAAYALSFSKNETFFRIIFPQAMSIFMPSYCGQAVELIKATAVVGYIAVNDLTKMGDIIRSNTYEAFFPLIATAIIYFILTWILSLLLEIAKRKFEPRRRTKEEILKGVKIE